MTADVCGIDLGKTVFHLVGLSKEGHVVLKKRLSRKQLITLTVNMPSCLIGMEACAGAHFLARVLRAQSQMARAARVQRVREQAARLPVTMLFPLVLFIFPAIFVVLLGPSLMRLMATLGHMN